MMMLIILLILSAGLNMVLIFVLVVKYDEKKLNIGVVKGKKSWDKRESIKERDIKRDLQRNGY